MSTYLADLERAVTLVSGKRTPSEIRVLFAPIRADLERVEEMLAEAVITAVPELSEALLSLVRGRGKRIRPALVLLASKIRETSTASAVYLATSAELLHVATLIHDDLIDRASVRRGEETLAARWKGTATVLAGDYLFAKSGRVAAEIENFRVFKLFSEAVMTICAGEIRQDFNNSRTPGDRQTYFDHIFSKTAALFMACTEGGAILSGASEEEIAALRDYGRLLGLAFQITDDTLDFTSTAGDMGKPVGSDLREGLITLPTIYFLERDPHGAEARHLLFNNGRDPKHVEQVIQAIASSPAIRSAQDEARELAQQAQATLTPFPDNEFRKALRDLADFVVERNT